MVDFENDIKNCVRVINQGGVILYPTDTVWGLGCNAIDSVAVDKVFAVKQRPPEKTMIVLLADARDILNYVAAPPPDIIAIVDAFERPTTVVYKNALGFPGNVVNKDGTIAIRVTTDPFCKALIKRLKLPLISTSANVSGQVTPAIFSNIDAAIIEGADYVVAYRQQDNAISRPSRLVTMDDDGIMTVLRD